MKMIGAILVLCLAQQVVGDSLPISEADWAAINDDRDVSLVGLDGLYVVVGISDEAPSEVAAKDVYESLLLLQLRHAGVRVFTDESEEISWPRQDRMFLNTAHLILVVNVLEPLWHDGSKSGFIVYSIKLSVVDRVSLNRHDPRRLMASLEGLPTIKRTVWEESQLGYAPLAEAKKIIKETVEEFGAIFIRDYFEQNSRANWKWLERREEATRRLLESAGGDSLDAD